MDRMRSWWRLWKQLEEEIDINLDRDERHWIVRNDATRIGALTFPFVFAAAVLAGAVWLPETIGKTDILQLGVAVLFVAFMIFLITRIIVLERKDVGWTNPSISPHTYLSFLIIYSVVVFGVMSIIDHFHSTPIDWAVIIGFLVIWMIFVLVYARRWHRDKQTRDD